MRRTHAARFAAAAIVIALALPAIASAPPDQYGTFGSHDITITDSKTHLRWQRGFSSTISWDDAHNYCTSLVLGGIGGWRLPSVKELMTLVDESLPREYVGTTLVTYAIDRQAFPFTPNAPFWAWPKRATDGRAWVVDFSNGESNTVTASSGGNFVRCVR
jgi:hypothetical protein